MLGLATVASVSAGCGPDRTSQGPQALSVKLTEVTRVNQDASVPSSLLGRPVGVAADGSGNIVVADGLAFGLKVFDQTGDYLHTIGSRGRGPGEIQNITGMAVVPGGDVLVADWRNARISRFKSDGRIASSVAFSALQYVREFIPIAGGYIIPVQPLDSEAGADYLFHVFDPSLERRLSSFGSKDLFYSGDDSFVRVLGRLDVGSMAILSDETMLYAPRFYEGTAYLFSRATSKWTLEREVRTRKYSSALEKIDEPPFDRGYVSAATREGGVIIRNESLGLWSLADGRIAHFVLRQEASEQVFGVEIISENLSFLGYGELDRIEGVGPNQVGYYLKHPKAKSPDDVFYFLEYAEDGTAEVVGYELGVEAAD